MTRGGSSYSHLINLLLIVMELEPPQDTYRATHQHTLTGTGLHLLTHTQGHSWLRVQSFHPAQPLTSDIPTIGSHLLLLKAGSLQALWAPGSLLFLLTNMLSQFFYTSEPLPFFNARFKHYFFEVFSDSWHVSPSSRCPQILSPTEHPTRVLLLLLLCAPVSQVDYGVFLRTESTWLTLAVPRPTRAYAHSNCSVHMSGIAWEAWPLITQTLSLVTVSGPFSDSSPC